LADVNRPVAFVELLSRCPRIEVPLIQRDYAQGRASEREVREDFLKALHGALTEGTSPLNLDFVYGSMEQGDTGNFLPLDGQQRLTTLFLLHWYLAWCDGKHAELERMLWDGRHSRFSYAVRPSSTEFFDQLVRYRPEVGPQQVPSVRRLLENEPWFFLHWRLDPTIQASLVVLDAIHRLFKSREGLFGRLIDEKNPAITFHLLPLKHFGLTDDLYIKMNARGKPLTSFETFKARFEAHLKELFPTETRELGGVHVSIAKFFENRIDTAWTDLFWAHRDPETNTFDEHLMNLLVAMARVTLDPGGDRFSADTSELREKALTSSFSLFHERGWLTQNFAKHVMTLLEAWGGDSSGQRKVLPDARYFDEAAFFGKAIDRPTSLDYPELVQLAAFVLFLTHHDRRIDPLKCNEWMRVVRNLAANSAIERPEEYGRALAGLKELVPHSADILKWLAGADIGQIGFSPQQVREEVLKARLLLADAGWKGPIDEAESHEYFTGQIEFLLDFCGALARAATKKLPAEWDKDVHVRLQKEFRGYLVKARITFNTTGLAPTKGPAQHLWKRALLAVGDYLASNGSNSSFLTNPAGNWDSWKRYLHDRDGKRHLLKTLWDRLNPAAAIEPQLEAVLSGATNLEPWRAAIVRRPDTIAYCGQQEIQLWGDRVYLLKKKMRTGYHAELFSYVLYLELQADAGKLAPLKLQHYEFVYGSAVEPHVLLAFVKGESRVNLSVDSAEGGFRISVNRAQLANLPDVEATLRRGAAFAEANGTLRRTVKRHDVHPTLQQIAQALAGLPS